MPRIKTSNCKPVPIYREAASFGLVPTQSKFKKCVACFFKKAKTAALQLRSLTGCGGESFEFKRTNN